MRDTLGLMMQWQGVDISGNWGKTEFDKALEKFNQLVSDNYIPPDQRAIPISTTSKEWQCRRGDRLSGDLFILQAETGGPELAVCHP